MTEVILKNLSHQRRGLIELADRVEIQLDRQLIETVLPEAVGQNLARLEGVEGTVAA